jgi:hypothetical protein
MALTEPFVDIPALSVFIESIGFHHVDLVYMPQSMLKSGTLRMRLDSSFRLSRMRIFKRRASGGSYSRRHLTRRSSRVSSEPEHASSIL